MEPWRAGEGGVEPVLSSSHLSKENWIPLQTLMVEAELTRTGEVSRTRVPVSPGLLLTKHGSIPIPAILCF